MYNFYTSRNFRCRPQIKFSPWSLGTTVRKGFQNLLAQGALGWFRRNSDSKHIFIHFCQKSWYASLRLALSLSPSFPPSLSLSLSLALRPGFFVLTPVKTRSHTLKFNDPALNIKFIYMPSSSSFYSRGFTSGAWGGWLPLCFIDNRIMEKIYGIMGFSCSLV